MIHAIVFDFDGVIVDSEPLHYRAFLSVLKPRGIDFDYSRYLEHYVGYDDRDGLRAICRDFDVALDDADVPTLIEAKARAFVDIVREGVKPFAGAVELIEASAAAMPIAISSGALRSDIEAVLGGLGDGKLIEKFSAIVTADEVEKSKPDPTSYRLAAGRLSIPPADCLAIEDTPAGLISARDAGLKTIAVTHSYAAEELTVADRIKPAMADITLEKIRQWF